MPWRRHSAALSGAVVGLCALALLAVVVAGHGPSSFDRSAFGELHGAPGTERTEFAHQVTTVGDGAPLIVVLIALAAAARGRWGSWRPLQVSVVALVVAATISTAVKVLVGRARPPLEGWLTGAHGNSFPSGHTTVATAGYLGLGLAVAGLVATRWAGRLAVAAGGALAAVIGWSRIELGVHWPTDVAAGWALGAAGACAALSIVAWLDTGSGHSGRRTVPSAKDPGTSPTS